mgnify:CR=1 FL=1
MPGTDGQFGSISPLVQGPRRCNAHSKAGALPSMLRTGCDHGLDHEAEELLLSTQICVHYVQLMCFKH